MDVHGKVAVVTGAGSGIGRATAQRLAHEGAVIVALDRDGDGLDETVAQIAAAGGGVSSLTLDVTDEEALVRAFERVEREQGGLDILVNNAGVVTGLPAFPDPESTWRRTLTINLHAVILGTQLAIPMIAKRGGGAISSTASLAGVLGFADDPVYAASKGGVVLFTRSLEPLKRTHNIRANCVCPGVVETPMLHSFNESGVETAARRAFLDSLPKLQAADIADAHYSLIANDDAAGWALQAAAGMPRVPVANPSVADLRAAASAGG